jgi:ABC-type Fe3+ transport system permease subunit
VAEAASLLPGQLPGLLAGTAYFHTYLTKKKHPKPLILLFAQALNCS